jgi:hypothetical protein
MYVVFLSLGIIIAMNRGSFAATRLSLHVTQEELDIWKQRAAHGPYKNTDDVTSNSPGDWTRILGKADAFLNNPTAERWSGQTTAACWNPRDSSPPALPGRARGEKLRDAGFAYLVTGTTGYRETVRAELLAQAAMVGTNFGDARRWCNSTDNPIGDGYSHEIVNWLTKLIFGYSYIRENLSSSDKSTLDKWFLDAGKFWENVVAVILERRFPNRNQDDYTTRGPGYGSILPEVQCGITHYAGFKACDWHEGWNNRNAAQIRYVAMAGILANDTFLKNQAKRYFREWLAYAVFPDGTDQEYKRWSDYDNSPTLGWSYAGLKIGAMTSIADHFARIGDFELYNYSTSNGIYGTGGGTKSLKKVIGLHMSVVNHTEIRYGTADASRNGNPEYLIDSVDELFGEERNSDIYAGQANIFYKDAFVKSIYTRGARGAPAYPADPATGGWEPWGGEWGVYPGALFLFGQMEGVVWPYSGGSPASLDPPTHLRILSN